MFAAGLRLPPSWRHLLCVLILLSSLPAPALSAQPPSPCGLVDAFDLPITDLVPGYDDFALYRARFGGNHTGLDIGFDRWGDPVRAAARGRVMLSNIEEWDTEKGVVVLEHVFPDGGIFYSVYGHLEQTDTILLPPVGQCVERGQVIGAIGWPSRGRPHLHYEVRAILPYEGGPGYVNGNPLEQGWYNPLDFTALWNARLNPAFVTYISFDTVASLPPIQLDNGQFVIASGDLVTAAQPGMPALWRIRANGVISGLSPLPGGRVVVQARTGQVAVLQDGRYQALWTVEGADQPFVLLGETLVFLRPDSSLIAYDSAGRSLWTVPGAAGGPASYFGRSADQIGLAQSTPSGPVWRTVSADGRVVAELMLDAPPVAAPYPGGGWALLMNSRLFRLHETDLQPIASVEPMPGRLASLVTDAAGNLYAYLDDSQRTLLSVGPAGELRWREDLTSSGGRLPPLLYAGADCLLYALDSEGHFSVIDSSSGALASQLTLYAGGARSASPSARLLQTGPDGTVRIATGYLTLLAFNSRLLAPDVVSACRLG